MIKTGIFFHLVNSPKQITTQSQCPATDHNRQQQRCNCFIRILIQINNYHKKRQTVNQIRQLVTLLEPSKNKTNEIENKRNKGSVKHVEIVEFE